MSKSAKNAAPAKKVDVMKFLPAIVLLIGLIIMTVCFIDVNNQLTQAVAANVELSTQLNAVNDQLASASSSLNAGTDENATLEETLAALTSQLEAANAAIAEKDAQLAAQQDKLDTATDALTQAMETLSLIFGEPAAEAAEEPAE